MSMEIMNSMKRINYGNFLDVSIMDTSLWKCLVNKAFKIQNKQIKTVYPKNCYVVNFIEPY